MAGKLKTFNIYGLWGTKQVRLKFKDNSLIIVGENGSGKTTILRMLYATLACRWSMLSIEDFSRIELRFTKGKKIVVEKEKIQAAQKLFLDTESTLFRELPIPIRRTVNERADISGHSISYDQLLEILSEYNYDDLEIVRRLEKELESVESEYFSDISNRIQQGLGCRVIYMPTYRRVEKRIGYVNERDYDSRRRYGFRTYNRKETEEQSIEIAKTGMDDVYFYIQRRLDEIHRDADISASRLNYQCFKGILNKESDKVPYKENIMTEEEIKKVFGSINEEVLSPKENEQIRKQLLLLKSKKNIQQQTYDQIVYYFYSKLHERYMDIKKSEKTIIAFFDACNAYLGKKRFTYFENEYSYEISIEEGNHRRKMKLEDLSSGEKQVVSILSYLYLSKSEQLLILIDEPELSLSVPWQSRFLTDIRKGNKCAGIVSVTHSPFIYNNELKEYAHSLEEFIY